MTTRTILFRSAAGLGLAALVALAGCGTRKEITRTYTKANVSELQLLEDKALLKRTDGVVKVITHLDDKHTARVELYMKEKAEEPAVRQILDLGYQQVNN